MLSLHQIREQVLLHLLPCANRTKDFTCFYNDRTDSVVVHETRGTEWFAIQFCITNRIRMQRSTYKIHVPDMHPFQGKYLDWKACQEQVEQDIEWGRVPASNGDADTQTMAKILDWIDTA